jgi:glycosyltransferase involved in cell wall biosynthesis
MGTDIVAWPYSWDIDNGGPTYLAYYGRLSNVHNREGVLFCAQKVMPLVWEKYPDCEFWIIGSHPSDEIKALTADSRIKVTGFVEDVASVLRHATALLFHWEGTFGFRSRLIEVMAVGVPTVASKESVYGMDIDEGKGVIFAETPETFAAEACKFLESKEYAKTQSLMARQQVDERFSIESTYGKAFKQMEDWIKK